MHRREMSNSEKLSLRKKYEDYLTFARGGFLTTNQKQRLLEMKRGKEGTSEADFWYRIKQSARGAIVDLQMICDFANRDDIKEIFEKIPLKKIEKNKSLDWSSLVSIDELLWSVLATSRQKDEDDLWKALLVKDIMTKCLNYVMTSGILMTKSHQRLVDEMRDLIDAIVSVSVQVPINKRDAVKF